MIKLRSFWVALAMGCAVSLGTTSCDDDDDDQPKQTNNNNNNNNNNNQNTTKPVTPEEAGSVMKGIVENIVKDDSNLLTQASSMTKDQLTKLASTIIEYDKNKDNAEWKETFIKQAGSEKAAEVLDETISKLVGEIGIVMGEVTPGDLVDAFSSYFKPVDQLGQGYKDGLAEGATHEKLCSEIYDDKIATMDLSDMSSALAVFNSLNSSQQAELINILSAWDNKKDDEEWKNGFIKGVNLNDEAKEKDLRTKLDGLMPYVSMIKLYYGGGSSL